MYCKKCGNQMGENERFCSRCGEEYRSYTADVSKDLGEVERNIDCGKEANKKLLSLILVAVVVVFDAVIYMDSGNDTLELMGKFFVVLAIALGGYSPIMYLNYQKRFCLIKENGVTGVGCGTVDFINKDYSFSYADIVSIRKRKMLSQIEVQTKKEKISVFLPAKEINSVYNILLAKMNRR